MSIFAVITGDIVGSSSIIKDDRADMLKALKISFNEINKEIIKKTKPPFEIYRGDSFQVVLEKPQLSLPVSLLIRAKMRSIIVNKEEKGQIVKQSPDCRIGIGIGNISFKTGKTIESDGEAYQLSGKALDSMKNTEHRLKIFTKWEEVNSELEVSFTFADTIIKEWSTYQAEAFYLYILRNETQISLAKNLNIAQSSVHKRLKTGKAESIDLFRKRFEELIMSKI